MRICNANVIVGAATLIVEWMAEIVVRNGSIIARDPEEQVRGASFNIQLTHVFSISKTYMLQRRAQPPFVDYAAICVAAVLACWA